MEVTCSQTDLSFALNTVSRAINNTNTLPVLNNVLIEAKENALYFSATNLEIAIKTKIAAKVDTEGGITIPARLLTSYVQLLNEKKITLSVTRELSLELNSEHDYTKIKGIKVEEFPAIPVIEEESTAEISAAKLLEVLQSTYFSASIHSSRPVLAGVFLKFENSQLIVAATDSYRLAERKVELKKETQPFTAILPVRTASELIKLLASDPKASVLVKLSKNQIEFSFGEITLVSRLIEGVFPDYEKIIPQEEKTKITVGTSDLILAIKKISLFAREVNNNMKLTVDQNSLTLSTDETKVGEGEITIPVKLTGEANQIAVNAQYLLEVLSANPSK